MVKPDMALPCLETTAQSNIDKSSIDESIKDLSITHSIPSGENRPSVLASLEAKRKEAEYRDMDTGVKWFIEGDIKGFFDNINHNVMIGILGKRIKDDRFLRLIRKFLNAGYMEDWQYHNTFSGTPQGGIVSPIFANIYLDELDKYMKEYAERFNCGKERKRNPEYRKLEVKRRNLVKKLCQCQNEAERKKFIANIREVEIKRINVPYGIDMSRLRNTGGS